MKLKSLSFFIFYANYLMHGFMCVCSIFPDGVAFNNLCIFMNSSSMNTEISQVNKRRMAYPGAC